MYTKDEIIMMINILSQITFKTGQSQQMKTIEDLIKKGQLIIKELEEKDA